VPQPEPTLSQKESNLRAILRDCAPVMVAFSGGVDSAYLAWVAVGAAGPESALAVIADSPSLPRNELNQAVAFAQRHSIPLEIVSTGEIERPDYRRNDADRCYFCKDELFLRLEEERARRPQFRTVAYGVNADEQSDFRPGQRAAAEHAIRAPLLEANLGKADIRALAREAGLEVWDKPASACLASRVAYGIEVTEELLRRIELSEEFLRGLGFRQFRVRSHDSIARIEIAREELPSALSIAVFDRIAAHLKSLGFAYVTLDLEGYRRGSHNAILPAAVLAQARQSSPDRNS
jgi:uncharacterized protein